MKFKVMMSVFLLGFILQGCAAKSDKNPELNHSKASNTLSALKVVKKQFRFIHSCQPFSVYENENDLFLAGSSELLHGNRLFGITKNLGEKDGVTNTIDSINTVGSLPALLILGIFDPSAAKEAVFPDYEIVRSDGIEFTDELFCKY